MKSNLTVVSFIDVFTYSLILLMICSIESIFFSSSNFFIEVDIWFVPLIYYFLHRTPLMGIVLTVLSTFILAGFTGAPLFQILAGLIATLTFVNIFKVRSFVKGSAYLYLTSMLGLLVFYFFMFSSNYVFYSNWASFNDLALLILVVLVSPGFSFIVEPLLKLTDSLIGVVYPFGFEV